MQLGMEMQRHLQARCHHGASESYATKLCLCLRLWSRSLLHHPVEDLGTLLDSLSERLVLCFQLLFELQTGSLDFFYQALPIVRGEVRYASLAGHTPS